MVRQFLLSWGYWAVFIGIFGEDMGLPLPGETVLVSAAYLARKGRSIPGNSITLPWLILVGIVSATGGDNLGFWLGTRYGDVVMKWIKKYLRLGEEDIKTARYLVKRHGSLTVFFARFIWGLRTVNGFLAGMLGMEWKKFSTFNFLGAAAWVVTMSMIGYAMAGEFNSFMEYFEYFSWSFSGCMLTIGYLIWRHERKTVMGHNPQPESQEQ